MLTVHAASRQIWITNVRFGSKAAIAAPPINVRFAPKSGHQIRTAEMLEWFSARSRVCSPSHLTTTAEVLLRADLCEGGGGGGWDAETQAEACSSRSARRR